MKRSHLVILIILFVLIIDQITKIYIKTHFEYGTGINLFGFDWARLHFVENEGMAFGLSFGGIIGKYILSIFRIILVMVLIYIVLGMIKIKENKGLLAAFALIIAGAIGNIFDSAFYGLIFSESAYHGGLSTMFPEGGGYAPFLQGKVVDMLYFPMVDTILPDWVPMRGGTRFTFFNPVFNVADSSISIGVALILIFYRSFFNEENKAQDQTAKSGESLEAGDIQ